MIVVMPEAMTLRSYGSAFSILESRGGRGSDDQCAPNDFDQRIARNPLHSHAGAGLSFARAEVGPVNFVQRIVLCLMGVESSFARRHRDIIGVRKTEKNL